jgi:mono/diheme cytochrome c family protein
MTKSQIWVASFLLLFLLLFLLSRLTRTDEEPRQHPAGNTAPQTDMSAEGISAADLITRQGCRGCHGKELEGTRMGPPLRNMNEYWSRSELINYMRNPSSYMDKDRFKKFQEQYPGVIMPSFSNVDVKDLGRIADYLLE